MTLCIAAICQDRGKPRIVIGTDWKASTGEAGAENQDKLRWITDNMPMLLAGTVSRAIELQATYKQFFESLNADKPPLPITDRNVGDIIRKPISTFKAKLLDEYTGLSYGLSYRDFRQSISKKEIPSSVAAQAYAEIKRLGLGCCIIIPFFLDRRPYIFKVERDGSVEECDNFAAIGSGSPIAEGVLFQRAQECDMTLGRTVYHIYEAMKLGAIASDVGQEHTINVLYPPEERRKDVAGDVTTKKADRFLARMFAKYGPKKFTYMPIPSDFWESDL